MEINKYFITHYTKLVERRESLIEQLYNFKIEAQWILDHDQDKIDFGSINEYYKNILSESYLGRRLRKSEISLILKHEECLKKIIENGYKNSVIFEDDIVLNDNFSENLDLYISQLPPDYDLFWIGSCCGLHNNYTEPNKHVYRNPNGSRCTHAFVISLDCAKKVLSSIKDIYLPIDFFYNKMVLDFNLNNYWAEPELVTQNENFKSSVQI